MSDSRPLRLQQMSFGNLVDQTFRFFVNDFKSFASIALLCNLPVILLTCFQVFFLPPDLHTMANIVSRLLGIFTNSLAIGAVVLMVRDRYLGGNTSAMEALQGAMTRIGPLILTQLLVGLWVGLGFMLLVIPGIIWYFSTCLTVPAVILESKSGNEALNRSKQLLKYNRGKVANVVVGVSLLVAIVVFSLCFVMGFGMGMLSQSETSLKMIEVTGMLIGYTLSPIYHIALTLLYFDLRVGHEAFDLEVLSGSEVGA